MMHRVILWTLLGLLAAAGIFVHLSAPVREAFAPRAQSAPGAMVVLSHAKWCGHCRELLRDSGTWSKLQATFPGVSFQQIDEGKDPESLESLGVSGFPDVRVVSQDGRTAAVHTGPYTADALHAFVLMHVPWDMV
jgi:thioredoxin-like negative regulator of GroEL